MWNAKIFRCACTVDRGDKARLRRPALMRWLAVILTRLSFVRRDGSECGRKAHMICGINRPVPDLGARRILTKKVVTLPVVRRPDGPGSESPAAVRADILQYIVDTRGAERTFVSTYARFKRVRRQRLVAVLAGRPEFKQCGFSTGDGWRQAAWHKPACG